ncbi:MAG: hypothetical protein JW990_09830 [Thermoleophilia bacterium]|nr:hypothetical protein [Thermoleophilia bacterium]
MRSVDVLMKPVHDDLRLATGYWLEFIEHSVGKNWRQRYPMPREQIGAISEALVQSGPFNGWRARVGELAGVLQRLADTRFRWRRR